MSVKTDESIHAVSLAEQCQNYVNNITKFFKTKNKINDDKRETKENNEFERIEKAKEISEREPEEQNIMLPTSRVSPTERKKKNSALGRDLSRDNTENLQEQNQIREKPIIGQEVTNTNISQDNKVIDLMKNKDKKKKKEDKKTKKFKDQELEDFRNEFAKKQGVKKMKAVDAAPGPAPVASPIKEDIALVDDRREMKVEKSKVEESLYEPVGEEREEFVNQTNLRDDNIIGFDLNKKHTETENKPPEEKYDHVESLDPPKLPARRKNSKNSATNSQLSVEEKLIQKEKKSNFIKEWQKDLRDFFTLRKKKASNASSVEVPRLGVENPGETEHLVNGAEDANLK